MSCIKSCTQIILIDGLHVYIPRIIFIYNIQKCNEVRRQKYFLQQQTAVQNPKQTDDRPPAAAPSVNLQSISTSTPIKQVDEIERDQLTNLTEMMRRQLATLNQVLEGQQVLGQRVYYLESRANYPTGPGSNQHDSTGPNSYPAPR